MKKLLVVMILTPLLSFPLLATEETQTDTGSGSGNEPMGSTLCAKQPFFCTDHK
jgi:hypothetical protein